MPDSGYNYMAGFAYNRAHHSGLDLHCAWGCARKYIRMAKGYKLGQDRKTKALGSAENVITKLRSLSLALGICASLVNLDKETFK